MIRGVPDAGRTRSTPPLGETRSLWVPVTRADLSCLWKPMWCAFADPDGDDPLQDRVFSSLLGMRQRL